MSWLGDYKNLSLCFTSAALPMLLSDGYSIHIHAISEPPLRLLNLDIVSAHLSLAHQPVFGKCPILEAVGPPPLPRLVMPFIPELDGNLLQSMSHIPGAQPPWGFSGESGHLPCCR